MSTSTDPGHFFQSDASEATRARKAAKASNTHGAPMRFTSKILDIVEDPTQAGCVYLAESDGHVRRVDLQVSGGGLIRFEYG